MCLVPHWNKNWWQHFWSTSLPEVSNCYWLFCRKCIHERMLDSGDRYIASVVCFDFPEIPVATTSTGYNAYQFSQSCFRLAASWSLCDWRNPLMQIMQYHTAHWVAQEIESSIINDFENGLIIGGLIHLTGWCLPHSLPTIGESMSLDTNFI